MAQGEAEYGCAQEEPSRPGTHEPPATGKHHRRLSQPIEAHAGCAAERGDEESTAVRPCPVEPVVPRQRTADPSIEPESTAPGCRSERPGWAGAHRHGPVRPARRTLRRERPPQRWC